MGISEVISNGITYLLTMSISDIVDVLLVAALIYGCIGLIRRTNAIRLARGIVFVLLVLVVSDLLNLKMISSLFQRIVELGLIAIFIIFQPEIRRLLERMGSGKFAYFFGAPTAPATMEAVINQTVLACASMSESKTGALIVFESTSSLNDPILTGTIVNAEISSELLRNFFFVNSPLHDGAVIVRDGRLAAAGCMLPLSKNASLSSDLGMRHRAGIGVSEHSDAVVAIVSEETGSISIAIDGMLKRHLTPETFGKILRSELIPDADGQPKKRGVAGIIDSVKGLKVKKNDKEENK